MNGGTFEKGVEKILAGIYFRFQSAAKKRAQVGERGTAALPFVLSWGKPKSFIAINEDKDTVKYLGAEIDDPSLLLVKEAKKEAKTVLVYRLNEGTKATAELGTGNTATAKYGGELGNKLQIRVAENVLDPAKQDVTVFLGLRRVVRQTIENIADFQANDYVELSGTGPLELTAGKFLAGGANGDVTNEDYMDFMDAAEVEYFDTIGLPVDDNEELKAVFASFVKRLRDQVGIKVGAVMANYAADFEGITNVTNNVAIKVPGSVKGQFVERELTTAESVAWATGASAGASSLKSLTFVEYEGAVDVPVRMDTYAKEDAVRNGEFIFSYDPRDKEVTVEMDINSFTSFTDEKDKQFSDNKIMRVLDGMNNDVTREIKHAIKTRNKANRSIGTDDDGAQYIRTLITVYMNELQTAGAIKNFDANTDIDVRITEDGDGFYIGIHAQPVYAAKKYYIDTTVSQESAIAA
ncbi:phage tail sheath protein [Sporosarcina sp. P37]|uniref:phage tail sheath family protein n=1 Tax=unclassified Sporosarcina TaxID=2647733 RepID=UPI000A17A6CB|nr:MULTISPECIES: phage tail sheath family protein [unclassified Sporosarcina]ARK23310.1 phage tail sheath protein [Sporosarcina sp. P37]PID19562.1 phage tail sheath protein [Sporosarcina sp. P35]